MSVKICRHCDMSFQRDDAAPIPHDRCERCHEEIEAMKTSICAPQYDPADVAFKPLPKQARYQDSQGGDWIDEFSRTATPEEFRGAMKFTVGKYLRRAGKKDALIEEVRKMRDYCQRWEQYEQELEQ